MNVGPWEGLDAGRLDTCDLGSVSAVWLWPCYLTCLRLRLFFHKQRQ